MRWFNIARWALLVMIPPAISTTALAQPHVVDYNDSTEIVNQVEISGSVISFVVENNVAYVTAGHDLLIYDVADPLNIQLIGIHESEYEMRKLALRDGTAFVSTYFDGLVAIDVSDPNHIIERSVIDLPGGEKLRAIIGEYALVDAGWEGVHIIDVSDPSNMVAAGNWNPPGSSIDAFVVDGDIAYASAEGPGLMVLDVSNPVSIEILAQHPEFDGFGYLAILDDLLYYHVSGDVTVWDLQNPVNPDLIALLDGFAFYFLKADGQGRLLVSDGSALQLYDNSDPTAPELVGGVSVGGAGPIYRVGELIVTLGGPGIVVVEEHSNWGVPPLGEVTIPGASIRGVSVHDDRAALALSDGRLAVVDVSDPASMVLGEILDLGNPNPLSVAAGDGIVVAVYDHLGLFVLDWSDPHDVQILANHQPQYQMSTVVLQGDLAYVGAGGYGILVYDLSIPSAPRIVGSWEIDLELEPQIQNLLIDDDVAVLGYAFYSDWDYDFHQCAYFLSLGDPTSPVETANMFLVDARYAALENRTLVTKVEWDAPGLHVYSLADLNDPELISVLPSGTDPIDFDGPNLYVSGGFGSVAVMDMTDPSSPFQVASTWAPHDFTRGTVDEVLYLSSWSTFKSFPRHGESTVAIDNPGNDDTLPAAPGYDLTCFPNPFNPRLTVEFEVPLSNGATLGVYDLRGQLVRHLYSGSVDGTRLTVTWSGTDEEGRAVPSGVYLVRATTNERETYSKVMLVR